MSVLRGRIHAGKIALAGVVAASVLALAACVGASVAPMTLEQYLALSGPAPSARIAYGNAPSQYVELFRPGGQGPFPVVILIHGGCFSKGFGGIEQMRALAGVLKSQGVAVWSVEYRRLDEPGGGYPGTFQDVAAAADALAGEAPARQLDLDHLVAVGHSVGGYLALWLASRERIPEASVLHAARPLPVRNVVSLGGVGDLRLQTRHGLTACGYPLAAITGEASAVRPDVFADTTPAQLLPNDSRTVLINGELDDYSPPREAADYAALVRLAGDSIKTIVLPKASHYDEVAPNSPSGKLVVPQILNASR